MADRLSSLLQLPGVAPGVEEAREACTQLRWHAALRRRIPEVAAESRVRGARASALLEGVEFSHEVVRDLMRGALSFPDAAEGPQGDVLRGAIRVTVATEEMGAIVRSAPAQALARLHAAAGAQFVVPERLGRPRRAGEEAPELSGVGPAPTAAEAAARLRGVIDLLTDAADQPAVVLAAVVHAEIATARPFGAGNALVARALGRTVLQSSGVDPTGTVVCEAAYAGTGVTSYQGALAAYATGRPEGVGLWLQYCCDGIVAGARAAVEIADAVLAGRLSGGVPGGG